MRWLERSGAGGAGPGRGGGGGRVKGAARRRCPLNWNGKQLPAGLALPGAADPGAERPARNLSTVSKKLLERVGVSESVEHSDGELVCMSERAALPVWVPRERSRGAAKTPPFSSGEGLDVRGAARVPVPEPSREGLSGPATSALQRRPPRRSGGGIRPDSASAALCDLTSPGSGGVGAGDVRVSRGPRQECPRSPLGWGLPSRG